MILKMAPEIQQKLVQYICLQFQILIYGSIEMMIAYTLFRNIVIFTTISVPTTQDHTGCKKT